MHRGKADLHTHTTASDGTFSPAELVHAAFGAGLGAIGIADHDTVAGIPEALQAAAGLDFEVVPAVEINTDWQKGKEVHILGYYVDYHSESFLKILDNQRRMRYHRGELMVEKLREAGVPITFEQVLKTADGASVGRPHVARVLVELGIVRSMQSAFGRFLVPGAPGYVPRQKLSPAEAVKIVLDAGGVACLAHPGKEGLESLVPELVAAGMQAIEVYHSDHTSAVSRRFAKIAAKYGLIATGGSDSHGPEAIEPTEIGSVTVDFEIVERLWDTAMANRKKIGVGG